MIGKGPWGGRPTSFFYYFYNNSYPFDFSLCEDLQLHFFGCAPAHEHLLIFWGEADFVNSLMIWQKKHLRWLFLWKMSWSPYANRCVPQFGSWIFVTLYMHSVHFVCTRKRLTWGSAHSSSLVWSQLIFCVTLPYPRDRVTVARKKRVFLLSMLPKFGWIAARAHYFALGSSSSPIVYDSKLWKGTS